MEFALFILGGLAVLIIILVRNRERMVTAMHRKAAEARQEAAQSGPPPSGRAILTIMAMVLAFPLLGFGSFFLWRLIVKDDMGALALAAATSVLLLLQIRQAAAKVRRTS